MPANIEHIAEFLGRYPKTRFIDVLLADLSGIFRGKRVPSAELQSVCDGGFLLPGSMFALDVLGGTIQETRLGFDEGDADRPCAAIAGTLLPVPWRRSEGVAQIQVSMYERDGQPFYGDPRHALALVLDRYRELGLMPVIAYRRYQPQAYVPLSASWAVNNRGVALRVPVSDAVNRRVEHRVAGADANPYLLAAAVLAGIHHGLTHGLEPGPPLTGNAYRDRPATLPITWPEAAHAFEGSCFIRDYFGEKFQDLFVTTRRGELRAFESHVTRRECEWYATTI
jgi:glutamine synthetase